MAEVFEQYGPYKRVRRLGIGGMAETFLAVQRGAAGFEQRVCMKFILPGYRNNADFKRLFLREASIAASLRHSNIVGVIDVDASIGYMVLELVDGVDLRTLLNAAPGRKLPPEIATLVTIELCKALAYAHGRVRRGQADGIVHRDVSPSNVLVSYAGEVKLTDFGVARAMRADIEPLSTTVKGKLCYMSPEQARGQLLDGRSDLFSVGVVFYELLSGQRPFDGNTDAETLLRVSSGQHTPLRDVAPEVPPGLAVLVERLIHRDREQRYASADDCIDALSPFAPRITSFRQLGDMARAARPHETLAGADLAAIEAMAIGTGTPEHASHAPLAATLLQTQALPGNTLPPRTAPPQPPLVDDELAPFTRSQTTLPSVHRNAWIALGVSFTLLLIVGFAWVSRITRQKEEQAMLDQLKPTSHVSTGAQPTDQPPNQPTAPGGTVGAADTNPTANPGVNPGTRGGTITIVEPTSPTESPARPDAGATERSPASPTSHASRSSGVARSDSTRRPDGSLRVGVIGWGRVWIDNREYGWAPVDTKLHPGRHVVAVGDTRPRLRQAVVVRPGEQSSVTLKFENTDSNDDATSSRADR